MRPNSLFPRTVGLFLVWAAGWGLPAGQPAEPAKAKPLTARQKARLEERDRLAAEAQRLGQQGKLAELVTSWEKKIAIEREVLGKVHAEVAGSLEVLARVQEARGEFKA